MLFSVNDSLKNHWQQPVDPNVPLDIEQANEGLQNPLTTYPTVAQTSAMGHHQFVVQISAVTQQPQVRVYQHMMAQDVPLLGQFQPPQNYPALGNFPNQYFPPTGTFMPAMPHFQPPLDWNTIIRAAVAAQTSHLQKEVEQMRSLIEGMQNTRSKGNPSSRLSKRRWPESPEELEGSCESCTKWRRRCNKLHANASSMYRNLQTTGHEIDLLKREIEIQKVELNPIFLHSQATPGWTQPVPP